MAEPLQELKIRPNNTEVKRSQFEREVPLLLPYRVNRKNQEFELGKALQQCLNQVPSYPLVCIIHGDEFQCHDTFFRCLKECLSKFLGLDPNQTVIKEYHLDWPAKLKNLDSLRELHWNITIYLGNVLKAAEGHCLLEVCSLNNLARLPWFRYGYMPDWLRSLLIATLTQEQKHTIRTVLQDLLVTAVQGTVGRFQLEVAKNHRSFLPTLANPILHILSRRMPEGSPLRDYLFLSFMTGMHKLALEVPDAFSRLLQKQKRFHWLIVIGIVVIITTLSFGIYYYLPIIEPKQNGLSKSKQGANQSPETSTIKPLRTFRIPSQWGIIRSVAISPDGNIFASGDDRGEVKLWNLSTEKLLYTLSL